MTRRFLILLVTAATLVAASLSPVVWAHQQKAAITTVLFNPRTANIEVMHRFYIHDAEHAVKQIFGKQADILDDSATQQKFARYVTQRFSMKNDSQSTLPLSLVGAEADGQFFWVYQETVQPPSLQGLSISHTALQDVWPSQINTVNIEGKGALQTVEFDENQTLIRVEFNGNQ